MKPLLILISFCLSLNAIGQTADSLGHSKAKQKNKVDSNDGDYYVKDVTEDSTCYILTIYKAGKFAGTRAYYKKHLISDSIKQKITDYVTVKYPRYEPSFSDNLEVNTQGERIYSIIIMKGKDPDNYYKTRKELVFDVNGNFLSSRDLKRRRRAPL